MTAVRVPALLRRSGGPGILLLTALACLTGMAAAPRVSAEPRHASLIVDANTGATLHAAAADELRHPASLTKMMTLYLAFEAIEQGRLTYSSKLKISQEAASAAPSKLELEPGEEITLGDAIKALVTKSANDMAVAVAERIGGTEANFSRLMTAKARQLGMAKTQFRNASGLPDPDQVTTARDMITLALHLQDDFPRHYGLFSLKSFTYNGASYRNHNTLLNSYRGTDGIKTGYTRMSGFNLVASVHRDGKHLVGAIFGGASASSRNVYLKALLDRSWAKASTAKTRKPMLVAKAAPKLLPHPKPAAVAELTPPKPQLAVRPAKPETAKTAAPAQASRPAPQVAAAPKTPAAPPAAAPAAALAPIKTAALAPPPETASDAADSAPEPAIQIAKVRRIMVAPRVHRPSSEMAALIAEGTDEGSAPARSAEDGETAAPVAPAAAPLPVSAPVASAAAPVAPAARPAVPAPSPLPALPRSAAQAPAKAAAPAAVVRGSPPSTLQAQANNMARGGKPFATASLAAAPAFLHGPKPAAPASAAASGAYQIQIGAFATPLEAEQKLAAVRQQAKTVLAGHQPLTLSVQKGARQLYRARFAGFSATDAATACTELRRLSHDCFVNKAE